MADVRYPWERDPLNEPPNYAERFDDKSEEIRKLKNVIRMALTVLENMPDCKAYATITALRNALEN